MSILACMVVEKSLTKNVHQKRDVLKDGRTDVNQYTPPLFQSGGIIKTGEGWFSIPSQNKLSSICIPNMSILVCKVEEKCLMKYFILQSMDGKK